MCLTNLLLTALFTMFVGGESGLSDDEAPIDQQEVENAGTAESFELVELRDGAGSSLEAIKAFAEASRAVDDTAALMLVDPLIRPLLIPEIAIEEFAITRATMELALFGSDDSQPFGGGPRAFGGSPVAFARRDLQNVRAIKVLETRPIDADRVVYTVLTTEGSYHDETDNILIRQFLTVRRSERWYVFRLFGMLYVNLSMSFENDGSMLHQIVESKRSGEDQPLPHGADFELRYTVPIETIHAELVKAAKSTEARKNVERARNLDRFSRVVRHRAELRGFANRQAYRSAFDPGDDIAEEIFENSEQILQPVNDKLVHEIRAVPE